MPTSGDGELVWPPPMSDADIMWLDPASEPPVLELPTPPAVLNPPADVAAPVQSKPEIETPINTGPAVQPLPPPSPEIPPSPRVEPPHVTRPQRDLQRPSKQLIILAPRGAPPPAPPVASPPAPPPQVRLIEAAAGEVEPIEAPLAGSALSLSCLLVPELPFAWHEAVAVVQQLADQLTRGTNVEPQGGLPAIADIGIEHTGHLIVRLDSYGTKPVVRELAYLLHQLLERREPPPALRLVVPQVLSDLPTITTVEDLSRELARWERPRRIEKLMQVYERARAFVDSRSTTAPTALVLAQPAKPEAVVAPVSVPLPVPRAPIELVQPIQPVQQGQLQAQRRPESQDLLETKLRGLVTHRTVVAGVLLGVLVLAVALGSLALFSRPVPVQRLARPRPPVAEAFIPPGDLTPPSLLAVSGPASGKRSAPDRSAKGRTPAQTLPSDPPVRPTDEASVVTARQPSNTSVASAGFVGRPEPAPSVAPSPVASPHPPPATVPAPPPAVVSAAPPSADVRSDHIYQPGEPGLVEAILVKPYLPETADPATPSESLGTLELVIDTAGNVESVRLRSVFNRYRERWWVYVAKNWKFRPAYKDGRPVWSVKRIAITDVRLTDPQ